MIGPDRESPGRELRENLGAAYWAWSIVIATSARQEADSAAEIKLEWLSIFGLPNDDYTERWLRLLSEQETSHREQTTENKEKK